MRRRPISAVVVRPSTMPRESFILLALLLALRPLKIPNVLMPKHYKMEPVVGFEPTTDGLQNRCSTTELNWLKFSIFAPRGFQELDHLVRLGIISRGRFGQLSLEAPHTAQVGDAFRIA